MEGVDHMDDDECNDCAAAPDVCRTSREVLVSEGLTAHQTIMTESKGNIIHDNALLRKMALKKFDEVGSIEARAVDRVLQKIT